MHNKERVCQEELDGQFSQFFFRIIFEAELDLPGGITSRSWSRTFNASNLVSSYSVPLLAPGGSAFFLNVAPGSPNLKIIPVPLVIACDDVFEQWQKSNAPNRRSFWSMIQDH